MKKVVTVLSIILILAFGCSNKPAVMGGTYESELFGNGDNVAIAFQPEDESFVQYITNREVDRGVYTKKEANVYTLKSDKQDFEIILDNDDSFEITIEKLNDGNPIRLENKGKTPTYFTTEFDDVEEYEKLLGNE